GIRDSSVTGVQTCALPISEFYGLTKINGGKFRTVPARTGTRGRTLCSKGKPGKELRPRGRPHGRFRLARENRLHGPESRPIKFRSEERRVGKERRASRSW